MKTQLLALFILLAVSEAAARVFAKRPPNAAMSVSNQDGRRSWPEFLDTPHTDKPRVILISNSQAEALDTPNPAQRYVAMMQAQLGPAGVQLENWSSEGILTSEVEILTAEAMRRAPALVVYVLGLSNFDSPQQVSLARAGSDIPVMAGNPLLWPALQGTLVWQNARAHDIAFRSVLASSALARQRIGLEDAVSTRTNREAQKALFGRILDLRPVAQRPPIMGDRKSVMRDADALASDSPAETATVLDVAALIGRRKPANTRVMWVWMPAAIGITRPQLLRHARDLTAASEQTLSALGNVHDLTTAFEDKEFLTQFHLNVLGHRHMAEVLQPLVLNALR